MSWERITADDVREGDVIAHTRNEVRLRVTAIQENASTRWIESEIAEDFTTQSGWTRKAGDSMGRIRPKRTTKLWRFVQ